MGERNTVLGFIKKQRELGASDRDILEKLLNVGWPIDIVLRALEFKATEKGKVLESSSVPRSKVYHLAGSFRSFL
jgi:hypothetical protein